jgi:Rrf2 family transcriptional regulator, iron-sulfur cluster assembly transcription factor
MPLRGLSEYELFWMQGSPFWRMLISGVIQMLFSNATGYALRALTILPEDGSYRLAQFLAKELGIPGPYLAKILQSLAQSGILESVRGPKGGFRFAKAPTLITVGDVVEALEGPEAMDRCAMGFPGCGPENPCPMHIAWSEVKAQLDICLTEVTIRNLRQVGLRRDPVGSAD